MQETTFLSAGRSDQEKPAMLPANWRSSSTSFDCWATRPHKFSLRKCFWTKVTMKRLLQKSCDGFSLFNFIELTVYQVPSIRPHRSACHNMYNNTKCVCIINKATKMICSVFVYSQIAPVVPDSTATISTDTGQTYRRAADKLG